MKKKIAILTGGGDVPGLNAAIKAFVWRLLEGDGFEIVGLRRGWASLINIVPEADADNSAWAANPIVIALATSATLITANRRAGFM